MMVKQCPICPPRKSDGLRSIKDVSQHLRWAHGRWAVKEYGQKAKVPA